MTSNFLLWAVVNSVFWYATIYYLFCVIKNTVNLYAASLIFFVLFSLALATCPFLQPMIQMGLTGECPMMKQMGGQGMGGGMMGKGMGGMMEE